MAAQPEPCWKCGCTDVCVVGPVENRRIICRHCNNTLAGLHTWIDTDNIDLWNRWCEEMTARLGGRYFKDLSEDEQTSFRRMQDAEKRMKEQKEREEEEKKRRAIYRRGTFAWLDTPDGMKVPEEYDVDREGIFVAKRSHSESYDRYIISLNSGLGEEYSMVFNKEGMLAVCDMFDRIRRTVASDPEEEDDDERRDRNKAGHVRDDARYHRAESDGQTP